MAKLRELDRAWRGGGWMAWCPGCENVHVYDSRWKMTGTEESPTFKPSYLLRSEFRDGKPTKVCHSWLRDGVFVFLRDCTHALAGQSVPLGEFKWGDGEVPSE